MTLLNPEEEKILKLPRAGDPAEAIYNLKDMDFCLRRATIKESSMGIDLLLHGTFNQDNATYFFNPDGKIRRLIRGWDKEFHKGRLENWLTEMFRPYAIVEEPTQNPALMYKVTIVNYEEQQYGLWLDLWGRFDTKYREDMDPQLKKLSDGSRQAEHTEFWS